MRVPGQAPGVSSGGGRSAGMARAPLRYNPMTRPGTAMGSPIGAIYQGRAWAGVGKSITQAAHAIDKLHRVRRTQTARLEASNANMQKTARYIEWQKRMAAVDNLPLDQIPQDIINELNIRPYTAVVDEEGEVTRELRSTVPKHEVFAAMEAKFLDSQTEASSTLISEDVFRNAWINDEKEYNIQRTAKSTISSIEEGVKYDKAMQMDTFKIALSQGHINQARQIVKSMMYETPEIKKELHLMIDKAKETKDYTRLLTVAITPQNAKEMVKTLDHYSAILDLNNKLYSGYLNDDERMSLWGSLQSKKNSIIGKVKKEYNAAIAIEETNGKAIVKGVANHTGYNSKQASVTLEKLRSFPRTKERDQLIYRIEQSMVMWPQVTETGYKDRLERHKDVGYFEYMVENIPEGMNQGQVQFNSELMTNAVKQMDTQWKNNEVVYINKYNDAQIQPINISDPDRMNKAAGFKNRVDNDIPMIAEYGEGVKHTLLPGEINGIQATFQGDNFGAKINLLEDMQLGFGTEHMRITMEQLFANNVEATYVASGELLADGKPNAAKYNLMGQELGKTFPQITNNSDKFSETFDEVTRGTYTNNTPKVARVYESSLNIYRFMSASAGDTTDNFDNSRYEVALKMAMGDRAIVQYKNSNIVPVDSSVTTDSFGNYIRSIQLRDVTAMTSPKGGFDGIKNLEFLTRMKNGEFEMINTGADEIFFIGNDGYAVKTKDGEVFTLSMKAEQIASANVPTSNTAAAKKALGEVLFGGFTFNTQEILRRQKKYGIPTDVSSIIERNKEATRKAEERIRKMK